MRSRKYLAVPQDPPELMLAIKAGQSFDGFGGKPLKDAVLSIENGSPKAVGTSVEVTISEGAAITFATDKTVMPGMFPVHSHPAILTIDCRRRWQPFGNLIGDASGAAEIRFSKVMQGDRDQKTMSMVDERILQFEPLAQLIP